MSTAPTNRVFRVIGITGLVTGLLCTPPGTKILMTMEPLHRDDIFPLWTLSSFVILASIFVAFSNFRFRAQGAALLLVFMFFFAVEAVARAYVRTLEDSKMAPIVELARRTYPDMLAFQAHPFLQFTGRPTRRLKGNDAFRGIEPFNWRGFVGPDWEPKKPENTVRIACVGGSTTGTGYPQAMEAYLRGKVEPPYHFETLNLGLGYYTSAHSVVNFALNVPDFSPDYVVVHHGWNDRVARGVIGPMHGDYSHVFKAFTYPVFPDALLIRGSVIYRWLKSRRKPVELWNSHADAIFKLREVKTEGIYKDPFELRYFLRNTRTIIDLALARKVVPVLVTQPYSIKPSNNTYGDSEHVFQCNAIVRRLAERYGDRILLVDLDQIVTGKHEEFFLDFGHMHRPGIDFKAAAVGDAILADWRRNK